MRRTRRSVRVGVGALAGAVVLLALVLLLAAPMLAATPTPGPAGDPRSSGQGPGLVGDPAFAVLAVLLIGLLTVGATLAYVRMTGGRRP